MQMIRESLKAIGTTARELFKNWRAMALLASLYALLLAVLYLLVSTREASVIQVVVTFALALAAPALFFILQAASANYCRENSIASLMKRSLKDFGKLVIVSLPAILLAVLVVYLLGKLQARFVIAEMNPTQVLEPGVEQNQAVAWSAVLFSTLRYLLIGLALPLTLIHLWLAVTREGLKTALLRTKQHVVDAFNGESVLIYLVGFIVFALLPYLLMFRVLKVDRAWVELVLLTLKLGVVFGLSLFGWVITMGALDRLSRREMQTVGSENS